jgi:hypothetical protein
MLNETIVSEIATKLGMPEVLEQFRSAETPAEGVNPFAEKLGLVEAFTADQLNTRLANERQMAAQEATRTATGNTYGAIDSRTLKATGIAKNEGESTVDYTERAFKEKFGTKVEESAELQRLRTELTARETALATVNTELEKVKVTYATERQELQINAKIDAPINALIINTTPELLDSQREFVKFRLLQKYEVALVDGKEQFTDKQTKEVKRDPKTAAPMTAAALVAEFAPTVVSLKQDPSAKPGSGYSGSGNNFNSGDASAMDFSKYTSKEEFAKDLAKQGLSMGSAKASELYDAFKKARPDLK